VVDLASGLVPDSILALHGVAAEGIVVGTGGAWADGLDEVSDISTFELSGSAYSRLTGTFSVERIGDEWLLFVEGFSAVDLSDSASRIGVWLSRADTDALVGFEADADSPTGSYLPAWPDGAVVRPIEPATLGSGEPDTSGSSAGDVWTSTGDGDPAEWAAPSGGGGGSFELAATEDLTGDPSSYISLNLGDYLDGTGSVVLLVDGSTADTVVLGGSGLPATAEVVAAVVSTAGSFDVEVAGATVATPTAGETAVVRLSPIAGGAWIPSSVVVMPA